MFVRQQEVRMNRVSRSVKGAIDNVNGGIAVPAIMYMLGVPFVVVLLLWALFFRG